MKRIVILLGIIMSFILIYNKKQDYILIPNEAIRVRVIANSDLKSDLEVKEKVKDEVNKELNILLKDVDEIEKARNIIQNNLNSIDNIVDKSLKELNYNKNYNIKYGMNFFPEKEFKGIKYNSGLYESLVVTLGDGEGSNYWCVLYPPLCSLDNDKKDIEYKSYVKELIDRYL